MEHGERLAGDAESDLDEAERQLRALEADRAEALLTRADEQLHQPDVEYYPERQILRDRLERDRGQLPAARAERAARELALAVSKQEGALQEPAADLHRTADALRRPGYTKDDVKAASRAADALTEQLKVGQELETKDPHYAEQTRPLYKLVASTAVQVALAEKVLAFEQGPLKAQLEAQTTLAKAKDEKSASRRKSLYADARDDFLRCSNDAHGLFLETPELARVQLAVAGRTTTARAVTASCESQTQLLTKRLNARPAPPSATKGKAKPRKR